MVFNRHSLVSDHSTYWDTESDFTIRLLQRLLAGDEATAFDEAQCARVRAAATARRRRLWQLAGFRTAVWIALVASMLWNRDAVTALGHAVGGDLQGVRGDGLLPDGLVAYLECFWSQPLLLGALALSVPLLLTFLVGYCGWLVWDRSAVHAPADGESGGDDGRLASGSFFLALVWLVLLMMPPMLFVLATPVAPAAAPLVLGLAWFLLRFFPGPAVWERVVPPVRSPR